MTKVTEIKVLDHGYVRLIGTMGEDSSIIEAARMSTDKSFLGWGPRCANCNAEWDSQMEGCKAGCEINNVSKSGDEKLLKYLYTHNHATPFEFCSMVIEVQAPILVFREWHRHRTQSYNEMSARYTPLPDFNYLPTEERLFLTQAHNTQAKTADGAQELTHESAQLWMQQVNNEYEILEKLYQHGLKIGIPKELARVIIPVGRYSKMRASANLRNWLGFLTLRMDPNAQWEIRQFANAVGELIAQEFPKTWELFELGRTKK